MEAELSRDNNTVSQRSCSVNAYRIGCLEYVRGLFPYRSTKSAMLSLCVPVISFNSDQCMTVLVYLFPLLLSSGDCSEASGYPDITSECLTETV